MNYEARKGRMSSNAYASLRKKLWWFLFKNKLLRNNLLVDGGPRSRQYRCVLYIRAHPAPHRLRDAAISLSLFLSTCTSVCTSVSPRLSLLSASRSSVVHSSLSLDPRALLFLESSRFSSFLAPQVLSRHSATPALFSLLSYIEMSDMTSLICYSSKR